MSSNTIPFQTEFERAGLLYDYPGFWNREVSIEQQDVSVMLEYADEADAPKDLQETCTVIFCQPDDASQFVMDPKLFDTVEAALEYIKGLPDSERIRQQNAT